MQRRNRTFKTSSVRTPSIARFHKHTARLAFSLVAFYLLGALTPVHAAPENPSVGSILTSYAAATNARGVASLEYAGTVTGEGLTGDFHAWRSGSSERNDERLGPRSETALRLGERFFSRSPDGNVRELGGVLRRRALTADFVESGEFLDAPDRATFLGFATLDGRRMWRLEVRAAGGEPETLWIDIVSGLPRRVEYLDGDGPTTIDMSDWRDVDGHRFPFHLRISDGDRAFDVEQQTTSLALDAPIGAAVFAPLINRTIRAPIVQTVPIFSRDTLVACTVSLAGQTYDFALDTGAQGVVLDSNVARAAGLTEEGTLEVRGANRTGGMHVLALPRLDIGTAHLDGLTAMSLDLRGSGAGLAHVDGILGFPFFAASLVEFDFTRQTMRFGEPGSFIPRGTRIPLDLDRGLIEVNVQVDRSVTAPFLIDTGNSGELLLYHPFVAMHPGIVSPSGKKMAMSGIGGIAPAYRSALDQITLGEASLYHTPANVVTAVKGAFADRTDAGNIGLAILKNFIVTFDLSNDAMYLQKGAGFDDGRRRTAITPS